MRKAIWMVVVLGLWSWGAAVPVGASTPPWVSPPTNLSNTCGHDVSAPMQRWLNSLPAGTSVVAPPGSCYLVDEGLRIVGAQGLTISGGTWRDTSTPVPGAPAVNLPSVFWLVGGSGITLENLTVAGVSPGGYNPSGAFNAGVRSDGVVGFTVANVVVNNVYGDGVELTPLRAAGDWSNEIINPTVYANISNVTIDGAGRQGVTLASVTGAIISSVSIRNVGFNAFDLEADQWNEGAKNVLINGCTVGSGIGALFFANGGAGAGGAWTSNITVQNCTMTAKAGGDIILVRPPRTENIPRGPFTFLNDSFVCGTSVYVSCLQVTDGQVTIVNSSLKFPAGTIHEPVYHAADYTALNFGTDTVTGFGSLGLRDLSSAVGISGGSWVP